MREEVEGRLQTAKRGELRGWEHRGVRMEETGAAKGEQARDRRGRGGRVCGGRGQPGCADSRSPTSRIRTSFFMSTARRGRARPARMERTPLAGSAHPNARLSPRCRRCRPASPAAPPEPRSPGSAAPPPRLQPHSRAGTAPAPPPPAPRAAAAAAGSTGRREGQALSERERSPGLSSAPAARLAASQSPGASPTLLWAQPPALRFTLGIAGADSLV